MPLARRFANREGDADEAPILLRIFILLLLCLTAGASASAAELVMFESAGCPYCARWNREIAPIYPKTDEGKRALLRRVDIAAPRPADLAGIANIVYTPTFVLIADGQEIGRIVGYRGDEIFWSLLSELFARLDRAKEPRRFAPLSPAG